MTVFILPMRSATTYRGKYPHKVRSVSSGYVGCHVELMNGARLWSAHIDLSTVKCGEDATALASGAATMTADQYQKLLRLAYISSANRTDAERAEWAQEAETIRQEARQWSAPAPSSYAPNTPEAAQAAAKDSAIESVLFPDMEPAQMELFTDIESPVELGPITLRAKVEHDSENCAPWDNDDGHGPVTGWTRRPKLPSELVLYKDRLTRLYYDFAAAVKQARDENWGIPFHRLDIEHGANGLSRANGQFFKGRELLCVQTDWHCNANNARTAAYEQAAAMVTQGERAALAARADFERLRAYCNDDWHYCTVIVEAESDGIQLGYETQSGIESDASEYILETANELGREVLNQARDIALRIERKAAAVAAHLGSDE